MWAGRDRRMLAWLATKSMRLAGAGEGLGVALNHVGGRRGNQGDDLVDLLARHRIDIERGFLRVGQEIAVARERRKGGAQDCEPLRRNARRRDYGTRGGLLREIELQDLALGVALGEVERVRQVGQFRV